MNSGQTRAVLDVPPRARRGQSQPLFEVALLRAQGVAQQPTFTLSRVRRVGSAGLNHIVIAGEGIAAYHAQLTPGTTAPLLVLDGNKAILNGVAVSGTVGLIPGDTLSIGEHNLRVSASGQDGDPSAGPDVEWRLVSAAGNASIALTDEVLIGSAATSAIRLEDPAIAAQHAQLAVRSGMLWLRDFSGGRTFVNAEPVNGARRLRHEDVLQIGSLDFRVVREAGTNDEPFGSITTGAAAEDTGDPSVMERAFVTEAPAAAEVHRSPTAAEALVAEALAAEALAAEALVAEALAAEAHSVEGTEVWRAAVFEVPTSDVPPRAVAGLHTAGHAHVGAPDRRESPRSPRREPAFEHNTRDARFGIPVLILSLTAAMAVAMWTPKLPIVERVTDNRIVVDAWQRARDTARSLEAAAVAWLNRATAEMPRTAPDATAMPHTAVVETPTSAVIPFVASDLLELQRKAASGDAAAVKRVEKLSAMYAELASSATARGDSATAQRFTAMGDLIGPTHATVETAVTAPPAVSVESPASPADALVFEARQLQSHGAASAQDGRSVVNLLLEALRLEPGHAEARRDLNVAIDSLNGRLHTLIDAQRFRAAAALLAQLSRDGIRVLSNGNVRDRPIYLDARVWRSLAVSSLLVDADELIQQGLLATPDQENAIARLEVATRLDPTNHLIDDLRSKSSGMLSLAADRATDAGLSEEAKRLSNLAAYVREDFGVSQ